MFSVTNKKKEEEKVRGKVKSPRIRINQMREG
jgi:hypothetical protein